MRQFALLAIAITVSALLCQPALAQSAASSAPQPAPDPGFNNSPDSVDEQLAQPLERADALFETDPLQPLHDIWERRTRQLQQIIWLDLGLNYTSLYQFSDKALPGEQSEAGSGDLDFFGRWDLVNRGASWPGALVFFTETRHRYTGIPPSELGAAIGSLWGTTNAFSTQSYALTELYWEQGSLRDRFIYRLGKMDPDSIYDRSRYSTANDAFLNQAFSKTLAMGTPGTGLGAAAAVFPFTNTYLLGGVHDANGTKTTLGKIERAEFFTALELGFVPRYRKPGAGLYHVTLWSRDRRRNPETPSGRGVALTFQQEIGPDGNFVPFVRYAYAEGGATTVRQAFVVGAGIEEPFGQNEDLVGIGLSWGQPTDRSLGDQYVLEAFYRIHVTPYTHLTPDLQLIFDPSENPDVDRIAVGSIRLRTIF